MTKQEREVIDETKEVLNKMNYIKTIKKGWEEIKLFNLKYFNNYKTGEKIAKIDGEWCSVRLKISDNVLRYKFVILDKINEKELPNIIKKYLIKH